MANLVGWGKVRGLVAKLEGWVRVAKLVGGGG